MEIRIDFDELKRLEAANQRSPGVVREELERAMTEADALLLSQVSELAPIAQGTLRSSLYHVERVEGLGVVGFVGSPLNYVQPVDLGTKPHFPPIDALIDWVRVKLGIQSEKEARGVAFLIARKIARVGTKGAHVFDMALRAQEGAIREIFRQAQGRIAARITGAA